MVPSILGRQCHLLLSLFFLTGDERYTFSNAFVLPTITKPQCRIAPSLLLQKKSFSSSFGNQFETRTSSSSSQLFGWFEERYEERLPNDIIPSKDNGSVVPTNANGMKKDNGVTTAVMKIEDQLECSIDNLDACIQMSYGDDDDKDNNKKENGAMNAAIAVVDEIPLEVVMECSIDNLDACMTSDSNNYDNNDDSNNDRNRRPLENFDQSLRKFLSLPIVELQLAILVLLSSFVVGLGTLQSIPPPVALISKYGELLISSIFTLEYIARWKLNDFSFKYFVTPLALIDLVAIIPTIIKLASFLGILSVGTITTTSFLGGALINLRLLRILRLQRVLTDYETFQKFEMALGLETSDTKPYQLQLARVVISIFTLLSVTSGLIYSAEHVVNPDVPDYFTALYFSLTTLTTVGFGDIHPVTNTGRWIISGSILVGSAVVPAQAAALIEALLDRQEDQKNGDNNTNNNSLATTTSNNVGTNSAQQEQYDNSAIMARMERLEQKLDDTNARIDRFLTVLETNAKR